MWQRHACCLTKYKVESYFFLHYTTQGCRTKWKFKTSFMLHKEHICSYKCTEMHQVVCKQDGDDNAMSAPAPSEMLWWRQVSVGTTVSDFISHILSISFSCDQTLASWLSAARIPALFLSRVSGWSGWMVQARRGPWWSQWPCSVRCKLIDFPYIWRTVSMSFHSSVCMRFSELTAS